MGIAQLMEDMAAKGASLDVILMAVRAVEAEQQKVADGRAAAAARKRRQRERERDSHATVTGQSPDIDAETPTPDKSPPDPQKLTPTPGVCVAPARKADPFPRPSFAEPQHWADFLTNRKRKKLPNTATAHARMLRDIERLADDEWPPGRILQAAAERGWAGIYDPRDSGTRNGQRHHHERPSGWAPAPGVAGLEPASLDD